MKCPLNGSDYICNKWNGNECSSLFYKLHFLAIQSLEANFIELDVIRIHSTPIKVINS